MWSIDKSQGDEDGWLYAARWQGPWTKAADKASQVRRRRWIRRKMLSNHIPTKSGFLDL